MFNFLEMAGNYSERVVGRHDGDDGLMVSTARVNDTPDGYPFETAVAHPDYNGGRLVIVEPYQNKEDAESGHSKWVETMTAETLPDFLDDNGLAGIGMLIDECGKGADWRRRYRKVQP